MDSHIFWGLTPIIFGPNDTERELKDLAASLLGKPWTTAAGQVDGCMEIVGVNCRTDEKWSRQRRPGRRFHSKSINARFLSPIFSGPRHFYQLLQKPKNKYKQNIAIIKGKKPAVCTTFKNRKKHPRRYYIILQRLSGQLNNSKKFQKIIFEIRVVYLTRNEPAKSRTSRPKR